MKDKIIEEYILNPCTLYIEPEVYGSKIYTRVYELRENFLVPFKTLDIINESCLFYGSDFDGRIKGSKHLTGITHKTPIAIDPTNSLYFFPTTSSKRNDCIWVNSHLVDDPQPFTSGITKVSFLNKKTYEIPVSHRVFNNQLSRAYQLSEKLNKRIDEMQRRKSHFLFYSMSAAENRDEYGNFHGRKRHFLIRPRQTF